MLCTGLYSVHHEPAFTRPRDSTTGATAGCSADPVRCYLRRMYATCCYCHGALGANEVVEHFPVGRKLAFDAVRGRLWAVCPRCARWNLSPLEERWEAIETCERLYRGTPLKASTDNIGLATLSEGLQLVRVGQPTRPEFAAWRYGSEFVRRRVQFWVINGGYATLAVGMMALKYIDPTLHSAIPAVGMLPSLFQSWAMYKQFVRPVGRVPHKSALVTLRRPDLGNIRLELDDEHAWRLNVLHSQGRSMLTGDEAQRVLGKLLAAANEEGGSRQTVQSAVKELAEAGSADAYVRAYIKGGKGVFSGSVRAGTRERRLALEMALHEDTERAALEGDLAALARAWEEAEEIAAIADNLLLPAWIVQKLPGATARRRTAESADTDRER